MSLFVSAWRGEEVVKQKLNRGRERGCNGRNVLTYFMGDLYAVSNVHNLNAMYSSGSMALVGFTLKSPGIGRQETFPTLNLFYPPKS